MKVLHVGRMDNLPYLNCSVLVGNLKDRFPEYEVKDFDITYISSKCREFGLLDIDDILSNKPSEEREFNIDIMRESLTVRRFLQESLMNLSFQRLLTEENFDLVVADSGVMVVMLKSLFEVHELKLLTLDRNKTL